MWAAIGGAIGGAIDPTVIQGPRIGEIAQQTASEGIPKPIVFAHSAPMPGNIICDSEVRKVYRNESGKGGPEVETESLYRTYAIGICEGPDVVLLRAWRNGQKVFDLQDSAMADDNALFLETARFFDGSFDQMPSPDLEAVKGVGNVSAHRGTAYIVFADEDVTDTRGSWAQWQFQVGRFPEVQNGRWWGISVTESGLSEDRFLWRGESGISFPPREYRGPPNTRLYAGANLNAIARTPEGDMLLFGGDGIIERYTDYTQDVLPPPTLETIYVDGVTLRDIRSFDNCVVATVNASNRYHVRIGTTWEQFTVPSGLTMAAINRMESGRWLAFIHQGSDQRFIYTDAEFPTEDWSEATIIGDIPSNTGSDIAVVGNGALYVGSVGRVYRSNNGEQWEPGPYDEVPSSAGSSRVVGNTVVFADVNSNIISTSTGGGAVGTFTNVNVGRGSRNVDYGNGKWIASGSDFIEEYLVSPDALAWVAYPNPTDEPVGGRTFIVGYADPQFNYRDAFYPLAEIIQELAQRANAASFLNLSLLAEYQCRGFTSTNNYPVYAAIQELSKVFFFNPSNVSGTIKFVPLGEDSVATITEADLIDNGEEVAESKRGDRITVPRVLHLQYFDVLGGGLNTDKQRSERPAGPRTGDSEQTLQTPVVLSSDEAATVVVKNHAMLNEQAKGELRFTLPDNWLSLVESDPVIVQYEGQSVRALIQQVSTDDGEQRYLAVRDRQSIYTLDVEGIPPAPVTPPPSRRIGPTLIEAIDGGPLSDTDDVLGFYVATTGLYPAWQGALVEISLDGGETYIQSFLTRRRNIMGTTLSSLGDHPHPYPDQTNAVTVSLSTPDAVLEGTTLAGMLNHRNPCVIGDEFVQFADVEQDSSGDWVLSYLLRGRKGTDTEEHAPASRFVMIDNLIFVPAQYAWRGQTITLRATSLGTRSEDGTIVSFVFQGKNQVERRIGYLTANPSGDDLLIRWQAAGRLGSGATANVGLNHMGTVMTVTDGTETVTIRTGGIDSPFEYRVPLADFSGPITITASQRNRYTGLGPSVELIYANP